MPLDTAFYPKPRGVQLRQRLMIEALRAGDRKAARNLARSLQNYRQRDDEPSVAQERGDWSDRCGW